MGTTLSPFRYLQLARYVIQRWIDTAPGVGATWRQKRLRAARASASGYGSRLRALAAPSGLARAVAPNDDVQGVAGPGPSSSRSNSFIDVSDLPPQPDREPDRHYPPESTEIYRLMNDRRAYVPGLMKAPREVVVLCHGLYGFSTATPIPLFPSLKLHYWASVLEVLRERMGVNVVVVGVKGTGSIEERAEQMHSFLKSYLPRGIGVNFVAHSMGGLDCRHLISTIRPDHYKPLSLTTIATPHRGSPFMDWCAANIGVGTPAAAALAAKAAVVSDSAAKALPFTLKSPLLSRAMLAGRSSKGPDSPDTLSAFTSAFTNYLLNIFDSPAYSNLTTSYLRDHFNPATPDDPNVRYLSVAGRISKMSVLHPLWFPKLVLDSAAEKGYPPREVGPGQSYEGNDGLVSVASAKWGEFLGVVDGCHHWDLRGEGGLWPQGGSLSSKSESERDFGSEDWNWQGDFGTSLGLNGQPTAPNSPDTQLDKAQHARDLVAARAMSKPDSPTSSSSSSSWDLAQVGQLIDWVADLFPGDKKHEEATMQLADARREKERDEASHDGGSGGAKSSSNTKVSGNSRIDKDKFDLARFYGGLMLRLREEGL